MIRVEEIRARTEAATEGPWSNDGEGNVLVEASNHETYWRDYRFETTHDTAGARYDAVFIAHARQDVPWLLAVGGS